MPVTPGRPRPIGRGPKVRAAVLAAAVAELQDAGFARFTIDNVARRAGVNKTTVYRRWGDRESLILDALSELMSVEIPIADTGSIETDLRQYAELLIAVLNSPLGRVLAGIALAGSSVPEIAEVMRRFLAERFHRAEPMVLRAIERGELPEGIETVPLMKTLIAPIYLRLLITFEDLDATVAVQATTVALAAARAGALSAPAPRAGRWHPAAGRESWTRP
jgi:AcrR family transcriptional regulator